MFKTRKVVSKVESEVVESIICDKCKKELKIYIDESDDVDLDEYVSINKRFDYMSKHFGDGSVVNIHICEGCLWDFMKGEGIS